MGIWVSEAGPSVPQTCWSITLCMLARGSESPSCLPHIDPLCLTAYKSEQSVYVLRVYVCVYLHTPPAPPSLMELPQEASRALPHLHSSQQLGTGLTGSFSPLCMEQRSSDAEEQPGTQSGFIISYLLSATNVHGARASLGVCVVGRHSTCASHP